jgi:tripeptidyl-peptidase-1
LVTPAVLQQAYGLGEAPLEAQNSTMAVAEFQGVMWDADDLQHFQQTCSLKQTITVDKQIGTNSGIRCKVPAIGTQLCAEALLDIEYIKAVAGNIELVDVFNKQYSLLNWAKQLGSMDNVPLVNSVSYGNDEIQQSSADYMDACNAQFMKLGARGVSILFASGDQGVWGRSGRGFRAKAFHPDFPASSPYVTSVGGTDFATRSVIGQEKAWNSGGGGFSNHFTIPSFQREAVEQYKKTASAAGKLPDQTLWNASGRGYPDVAALGGQQNSYCVG